MAITNFIPELWSARLFNALEKQHVASAFVNTDYTGMISNQGDTVHITTINNIAINKYTKGTPITTQDLTDNDIPLVISEADYFSFAVDDIDAVQSAGNLIDSAMQNASYGAFSSIFCLKNQFNAYPFVFFVSSYLSYTIAPASLAILAVLSVQLSAIT